jgi:hypothetical protein
LYRKDTDIPGYTLPLDYYYNNPTVRS